jgi:hypothetical protein
MLVKFLSFIITVFGTKRYKPFLGACLALVISLGGISIVAAIKSTPPETAASTASRTENTTRETISAQTPRKQATRTDNSTVLTPPTPPTNSAPSTPRNDASASPTPASHTTGDIVLTPSSKTLSVQAGANAPFSASAADGSSLLWAVSATGNCANLQIAQLTDQPSNPSTTMSFSVKADASAKSSPEACNAVITAKDTAHGLTLTESIAILIA